MCSPARAGQGSIAYWPQGSRVESARLCAAFLAAKKRSFIGSQGFSARPLRGDVDHRLWLSLQHRALFEWGSSDRMLTLVPTFLDEQAFHRWRFDISASQPSLTPDFVPSRPGSLACCYSAGDGDLQEKRVRLTGGLALTDSPWRSNRSVLNFGDDLKDSSWMSKAAGRLYRRGARSVGVRGGVLPIAVPHGGRSSLKATFADPQEWKDTPVPGQTLAHPDVTPGPAKGALGTRSLALGTGFRI